MDGHNQDGWQTGGAGGQGDWQNQPPVHPLAFPPPAWEPPSGSAAGQGWAPPSVPPVGPGVFNPYEPAGAALPPSPSGYADPTGTADATGTQATRRRGGRIGGALAAAGAALAKYGAILYKLKVLATMASVLVSIAAYSLLWGWTFAVGFVVLLAVHESGHALELRRQGIPASAPMFIPFMGAVISMKGRAIDAYHEALVGLAGPAFGAAASLVVGLFASSRHSNFLMALSFVGFFLNLINLFPVLPLDGGRAVGALHPAIWALGLVGLVGVEIWRPNPLVFIVILLGASELWRRWKQRDSIASRLYFNLRPSQRAGIALAYVTLVAVCVIGMNATYLHRTIH